MRFSIYAPLPERAYDALLTVAEQDLRDPRKQAAKFIIDGLRRAGALPAESTPLTPSSLNPAEPGGADR